jgi:hypothetical protein
MRLERKFQGRRKENASLHLERSRTSEPAMSKNKINNKILRNDF